MKTNTKKELLYLAGFIVLLAAFIIVATRIVEPKRTTFGSTWGQFEAEEKNSVDVMFYGSSIAYCDVVPAVIWRDTGVTSYVMAGPEQTVPFSYYYLAETYKTQSPKLVCIEVTGMFFKKYQDFTLANVGNMPYDKNRFDATLYASEKERRTGLFFPLYDFHSRWSELEPDDYSIGLNGYKADDLAGYTFLSDAGDIDSVTERGEEYNAETYAENLEYLKKISALCAKHGTKLLFYIAPTCWKLSDEHLAMLKSDISGIDGADFIDFNDYGLSAYDIGTDFYDELHFNCRGAEKFSSMLAKTLAEKYSLSPTNGADSELWQHRLDYFSALAGGGQ